MHYVYVLRSENGTFYIGRTNDVQRRLAEHNEGRNRSTVGRVWCLVYYEAYPNRHAALRRERVLKKDGRTRRALMDRVKASLAVPSE